MTPQEVILDILADGVWSFDGDALVRMDHEGGNSSLANVRSDAGDFPVHVDFIDDAIPDFFARDERELRTRMDDLKTLSAYRNFILRQG